MAVTAFWYGKALINALGGETEAESLKIDWLTETIKVALVKNTYTPNQDTHETWADVSANEVAAGNGYTAGGITLANKTIAYDGTTNIIKLDADDVTWATSTITARYAVIYDSTNNLLLGYVDFGADQTSTSGDFTISWSANGIFKITVA